jgi:HAE1 family hydrophobic/amphiphilic exporter-1
MAPLAAAKAATAEIGLAVLATTLSLVVVFVPVSFMSSISGRFLYQFGITAAAAVLVSLLVSFTLTPTMSARLLQKTDDDGPARSRGGLYARLDAAYARWLAWALDHRRVVAIFAAVVMLSSVPLYRAIHQEYVPSDVDEAEFYVWVTAPEGHRHRRDGRRDADGRAGRPRDARRADRALRRGGGFLGNVNTGYAYVRIKPHAERYFSLPRLVRGILRLDPLAAFRGNYTQRDVMQALRAKFKRYGDLRISVRNAPAFNLGGAPVDIDFNIRGPDLQTLRDAAEKLRTRMLEMGGIADADTTLKLDKPELRVVIDRDRAADLGVDVEHVAMAMRLMVGGDDRVSRFVDPTINEDYDVEVRLEDGDRNDPATIAHLYVRARRRRAGAARQRRATRAAATASRIDRLDRQRVASIRATVAPGYAMGDRLDAVRAEAAKLDLPPGYTTGVSGRGRELERTFVEFIWAFLLSIAFMYMILAAQYESLVDPVTILLSLPLAVAVRTALALARGNTLKPLLGARHPRALRRRQEELDPPDRPHQAAPRRRARAAGGDHRGSRDRLRPILMTTLTLVAGMLPLAIGRGPGAEERYTIAVVVIGGQSLSLLLTLIVTPVAYAIFDDLAATLPARVRTLRRPRQTPVLGDRPRRLRSPSGLPEGTCPCADALCVRPCGARMPGPAGIFRNGRC